MPAVNKATERCVFFLPRRWWERALPSHVLVKKSSLGYHSASLVRPYKFLFHIVLQSAQEVTLGSSKLSSLHP